MNNPSELPGSSVFESVDNRMAMSQNDFNFLKGLIFEHAGITLSDKNKSVVEDKIRPHIAGLGFASFEAYIGRIRDSDSFFALHKQGLIDHITTNETFFFREPRHFEFLKEQVVKLDKPGNEFKVWSAASSSGEEAYSIAMLLKKELLHAQWHVLATDISSRVLKKASEGHYSEFTVNRTPEDYRRRYLEEFVFPKSGGFELAPDIRSKVEFRANNLATSTSMIMRKFDMIFLRNVLIYFNSETKNQVISNLTQCLKPGGFLVIGHSENLMDVQTKLKSAGPSIYTLDE